MGKPAIDYITQSLNKIKNWTSVNKTFLNVSGHENHWLPLFGSNILLLYNVF